MGFRKFDELRAEKMGKEERFGESVLNMLGDFQS